MLIERQKIINELNECRLTIAAHQEKIRLYTDQKEQNLKEMEDIKEKIAKSQIKFDSEKLEKDKSLLNDQLSVVNSLITSQK
mgnify:FL=1